jgi:hypothetical protein
VAELTIMDDDGNAIEFEAPEALGLMALTENFDTATTSACPDCRSRVISVVALADLLDDAPPHPRTGEILELADEAPTLHLYVIDRIAHCPHPRWRDPGHEEWVEAVSPPGTVRRRP